VIDRQRQAVRIDVRNHPIRREPDGVVATQASIIDKADGWHQKTIAKKVSCLRKQYGRFSRFESQK
jgi:hypothetical protein